MKNIILIILLLTFTSCTQRNTELENKVNIDLEHLCDNTNFNNRYLCAQFIEKSQLTKYASDIARSGDHLSIRLKSGQEINLKNINPGESGGKSYSFRTYLKSIGYYLLETQYWEGGAYLLINDFTGKEIVIDALPIISRDGKRFITASFDIETRYTPNRIQIFKLTSAGPSLEWSYEPTALWGAENPEWIDNETIKLDKATLSENGYKYAPLTIVFRNNIWNLTD